QKLKNELPAIIKWCVDCYLEWQRTGLVEPKIIREQSEEYRTEMDPIEMFLDECCRKRSETSRVTGNVLFQAYDMWAKENHQYRMASTKFGKEMKKKL
ncbi:DNA primase, partial [Staphylococcus pseudintermedius]|uniref:primase-like DNA-binding domain-containing protein n=1 Tax=Staphylococcus pseudintermedius TaxID=283734 RepID=UPI0010F1F0D3